MSICAALLPEFDQEMANTRKTLARVPEDKFGWKPHAKSGSLGWLASHIADLPGLMFVAVNENSVDIAPGGKPIARPGASTHQELMERFDANVARARAALAEAPDAKLTEIWSLLANGAPIVTLPRSAVIRTLGFSHIIHHRAQLGVYLRLNDIAVPSIYGPSADEGVSK